MPRIPDEPNRAEDRFQSNGVRPKDRHAALDRTTLLQDGVPASFKALLTETLDSSGSNGIEGLASPAPEGEALDLMVHLMNARMNSLWLSLGEEDAEGAAPPFSGPSPDMLLGLMASSRTGRGPSIPGASGVREVDGIPLAERIDAAIDRASETCGVDRELIRAVIRCESDFDPNATSSKGAMGLMQLMPETAGELGVSNAYDPEENILGGTRYLKMLLDRFGGDPQRALSAYNWGMGNLERNPGRLPRETRSYVDRVMGHYRGAKG